MLQSRLFFRIYVTVLVSLALTAILIASFTAIIQQRPRDRILSRSGHFLEIMLPPSLTGDALQAQVSQMAHAFQSGILVFSPMAHCSPARSTTVRAPCRRRKISTICCIKGRFAIAI